MVCLFSGTQRNLLHSEGLLTNMRTIILSNLKTNRTLEKVQALSMMDNNGCKHYTVALNTLLKGENWSSISAIKETKKKKVTIQAFTSLTKKVPKDYLMLE